MTRKLILLAAFALSIGAHAIESAQKLDCSIAYAGAEDGIYNFPFHSTSQPIETNGGIAGTIEDSLVKFDVRLNKNNEIIIKFMNKATKKMAASEAQLSDRAPAKMTLVLPMNGEAFTYKTRFGQASEKVAYINLTCTAQ